MERSKWERRANATRAAIDQANYVQYVGTRVPPLLALLIGYVDKVTWIPHLNSTYVGLAVGLAFNQAQKTEAG